METKGKNINKNLDIFLTHIDAIKETLLMTLVLMEPHNKKANDDFVEYLKNDIKEIEDDNGEKRLLVKADEINYFETLEKNATISVLAKKVVIEGLFVSLISQYDAFLTRLLKAIFEIKPDALNSSERNLTFSQLVEIDSIDKAREFIIEKEIDTVLRKSHSEQFDYLEKLLGIKLKENLPIWTTFIEITERRNLFVHCDGYVTNQYIKVCSEKKFEIENLKVGEKLFITGKYFNTAFNCLYEIATKLSHTVWRKLLREDIENADKELNRVCFDLINSKSYHLADILLDFAINQRIQSKDYIKNILIINAALSKYLNGKKLEAKNILGTKDWSAASDNFKLANYIISEDYKNAYEVMRKIGNNGDVEKSDYKNWPLFNNIRKKQEFKKIFKEIFGEEYTIMEIPKKPLQEIISKEIKNDVKLKNKTTKIEVQKKTPKSENITRNKSKTVKL